MTTLKAPAAPMAANDPIDAAIDGLGILARRKIEAEIIKPIYEGMVAAFGREAARKVLAEAITKAAVAAGQRFAEKDGGEPDLAQFAALQHLWTKDDALVVEVLVSTPDRFDYNVKRCRYAETYRAMGLADLGGILSCQRDGTFCQGYNPKIRFERTQTLMEGASHCDFRYSLRQAPEA